MVTLCDIKSREDLAKRLNVSHNKLTYILYIKKPESYYETFEIPKRYGEMRTICASNGDLKVLQVRLSKILWEHQKSLLKEKGIKSNLSHAFEKGKSIITNAFIHRNKRYVLNLDLKDFFSSFHFGRVLGYFEKNRYFKLPHDVAVIIAQLTCYNGCLPQGAPTSPIITNLICQTLDIHILKLAKQYRVDYTRYADDMTFSTNDKSFVEKWQEMVVKLSSVIKSAGFEINEKKTRLQFRDSRQKVTGLVVNKKLSVNRNYVRKTRAMAHQLYSSGEYYINGKKGTIRQLEGRFSFINQLDFYNNQNDSKDIKHNSFNLNGREKQYQAFLFFKYFFYNEKPIVVTEGKTDVLFIKAALKKFCDKYPRLIQKDANGRYVYGFSFLRRTRRWKYFFNISLDGADTIQNLYYYHSGKNKYHNYLEQFEKLGKRKQRNPVIFLYDNELLHEKPLKKFINQVKDFSETMKESLKTDLNVCLICDSKLFVVTNPLVDNKEECEIEDLFLDDLLNMELNGKIFSRNDKLDSKLYFGKDRFSRYVYENYKTIDFSRFKPLLDAIDSVIERCSHV